MRDKHKLVKKNQLNESLMLMKRSPFLGEMDDSFLNELAKKLILKSYPAETKIYKQEHISKGIYILIDGDYLFIDLKQVYLSN